MLFLSLSFDSIYGDNKRPFVYFEVIDLGGEPIKNTDYTWMARVSEFRYGKFISEVVRKDNGQKLRYLNNFGTGKDEFQIVSPNDFHSMNSGWGMIPDGDSQIMVDNHDNQRGHGSFDRFFFDNTFCFPLKISRW